MEGHVTKCVTRYCELANKTTQQLYKVSTPCIDDHRLEEKSWRIDTSMLSNFSELLTPSKNWTTWCSTVSKQASETSHKKACDRLAILWTINKLARSITQWTKACDKRLNRLMSYINHTCEYKQYFHEGNTTKQCRPRPFKTPIFQEILSAQNPLLEEHCAFCMSYICSDKLDV